ncbi:Membrane-associated protease RseP [Pseudomonas syringae pv. actinidiae]|uniref:Membrane-associated protease RseP n=1 Tax=Pseudomonas syringae pv. actinidiae TaxID=103796 RepID=A0A2V0QEU0_PSESF|nr:Membrane-associated protease RseP [Pseudomonas syringae pv. actinidiae]
MIGVRSSAHLLGPAEPVKLMALIKPLEVELRIPQQNNKFTALVRRHGKSILELRILHWQPMRQCPARYCRQSDSPCSFTEFNPPRCVTSLRLYAAAQSRKRLKS